MAAAAGADSARTQTASVIAFSRQGWSRRGRRGPRRRSGSTAPALPCPSAWSRTLGPAEAGRRAPAPVPARRDTCLVAPPAPVPATARARGLGEFDLQRPAVHFLTVELLDRGLRLFGRRHLDETEAARATGALLHHDRRRLNAARLCEHLAETLARRRKGQTPDEQFVRHRAPPNVSPAMNEHALGQRKTHSEVRDGAQTVHRSEEHTSELQSRSDLVCRLLLEKKKNN